MACLTIRFLGRTSNLYDVGYLSVDMFQLIAFSEALDDDQTSEIERWYGEKARPFNRYASILEKLAQTSQIVDVRRGSTVLEIVLPVLATCICTLVVPFIQHHIDNAELEFNVESDDKIVQKAIEAYSKGAFGRGSDAIEKLSEYLAKHGREVEALGKNAYTIHRVLTRYSARIVRTITRP